MLYLIAARLYRCKVAVLAAAFSTLAVMQIQQSHFYTVDEFANFFMFPATYIAFEVMVGEEENSPEISDLVSFGKSLVSPLGLNVIGFGLALGMSVASKLNTAPLAILLPGSRTMARSVSDRFVPTSGRRLPDYTPPTITLWGTT